MKARFFSWVVALAFLLFLSADARAETQPGAAALESRLYAPCCYNGTLDSHESELARELRKEISGRLAQGEAAEAIQADFVARYGDRVLAARSDKPIRTLGLLLVGLMVASGLGLGLAFRRWTVRPGNAASAPQAPVGPRRRDALDDRLDAELAELD